MQRFRDELEASRNTVTRDFEYMRDQLGAPIEYCREQNGHRYAPEGPVFELPGFWMNASELHALLACEQMLEQAQPRLMANRLEPLRQRIQTLLGESGHDAQLISERIQIKPIQTRTSQPGVFNPVAEAALRSYRLCFTYLGRGRKDSEERVVQPQRLLHYRSNWYLVAWCEAREGLRIFSLDRIRQVQTLDSEIAPLASEELDAFITSGFGIFGGAAQARAHLVFTQQAAEWVSEEQWHTDQLSEWKEGAFHLWVPYANDTELTMEILRYGPDVEVLEPAELREKVRSRIEEMSRVYC